MIAPMPHIVYPPVARPVPPPIVRPYIPPRVIIPPVIVPQPKKDEKNGN